jgi:glycosyltransferase involved in cell wall biosynthesis
VRISHVVWSFARGGLESLVVDLCNQQLTRNAVQLVVVNDVVDEGLLEELAAGVVVARIGRPPGSIDPRHLFRVLRALAGFAPDVLHIHQNSLAAVTRWSKVPTVLTVHDTVFGGVRYFRHCDKVIAISESVKASICAQAPGQEPLVIFNGIRSREIRVSHQRRDDCFRIIQVGRLELPKKGHDIAIEAMAMLAGASLPYKITLDFVGSGPAFESLEAMIESKGLRHVVRMCGAWTRARIYDSLTDYHLLIQPSRFEGFGLTVAEAMAAEVPVLVSNIDGPRELVADGMYGGLFETGDALDLAGKIAEAAAAWKSMAADPRPARARRWVSEKFDVAETARAYELTYAELVSPTGA